MTRSRDNSFSARESFPFSDSSVDPMDNCESFESLVQELLDERVDPSCDPRIEKHAGVCPPCAEILSDYCSVGDSAKLLPHELAEILANSNRSPARLSPTTRLGPLSKHPLRVLLATASVALIAVTLFQMLTPDRGRRYPTITAVNTLETPLSQPRSTNPKDSLNDRDQAFGEATASGHRPTGQPTPASSPFSPDFSFAKSIPQIPQVPDWQQVSRTLVPLQPMISISDRLPYHVRPVKCSLDATIGLLRHSLKVPKADRKSSDQQPADSPNLGLADSAWDTRLI